VIRQGGKIRNTTKGIYLWEGENWEKAMPCLGGKGVGYLHREMSRTDRIFFNMGEDDVVPVAKV